MPFFQNPFVQDYTGSLMVGDRQFSLDFKCPRNVGRGDETVIVWKAGPYDLTGIDSDGNPKSILLINFSLNFKDWSSVSFDITTTAASPAAVTALEIASALATYDVFTTYFETEISRFEDRKPRLTIRQKLPQTRFRFYIRNGSAEETLIFNYKAGVAELPTYFARHAIGQQYTFADCQSLLIPLDPINLVEAAVIDNAVDRNGNSLGYDSGTVKEDWEIFRGRGGNFMFKKITVDGSDRITEVIEYTAGSLEGDLARKIQYVYSGANTNPDQITEIPYILTSGDLVTP